MGMGICVHESDKYSEIAQLVERLKRGDDAARAELIEISYERIRRLAAKMIKGFPVVHRWLDTDDLMQRAATRLWQSLEKISVDDPRHFMNLSAVQMRRELLDLARTLNGPSGLAQNHDSTETADPDAAGASPMASESNEASKLSAWSEFHEIVGELRDEERETFELIWYHGLSQDNVAKLIQTSQKTVSRRWQRARLEISRRLDGQLPK